MSIVIEIVLPVFGIALMGYLATRLGWFSETAEKGVNEFIFSFAAPLMLFNILSQVDLPEHPPLAYFASFYGPLFITAFLAFLASRYIFGRNYTVQVISGFTASFGNTILLGLPLLLLAFGDEKILPFYILLSIHGLTLFTLVTILLEIGKGRENLSVNEGEQSLSQGNSSLGKTILTALIKNPILIAIITGMICNLGGITLPTSLITLTGLMKGAVVPAALFALGSSLTRYGIRGRVFEALSIVFLKIILFPFLVFLSGTYIFDIDPFWVIIAVITAAQPPGVMSYMFASRYKVGEAVVSTSIFLSAILSMVTLTIILYLFEYQ
ncbi:MAG: AEC family transporter [Alphaproteobacteria bacterium]|nr:AEC family transporter [Alphaproteobacteria bacterium]